MFSFRELAPTWQPHRRSHSRTPCLFRGSGELAGKYVTDSGRWEGLALWRSWEVRVFVCEHSRAHAPVLVKAPVLRRYLVSIQESGSRGEHRKEGGGGALWMCQHFYFLHHKARLDTNNGTLWQPFRKTMRGKWDAANPGLYANPPDSRNPTIRPNPSLPVSRFLPATYFPRSPPPPRLLPTFLFLALPSGISALEMDPSSA